MPIIDVNSYPTNGRYRNKKTDDIYIVTGLRINSTNAQNGQVMVEYESNSLREILINEVMGNVIRKYVREVTEFQEKFEKVD